MGTDPVTHGTLASEHLELLLRVTEQMTVHRKLEDVLGAISAGLVANVAGTALVRVWLHTTGQECAVCRRRARPGAPADDVPSLHLCATAGVFRGVDEPHHVVPVGQLLGGRVAASREPLLVNDLGRDPSARELPWIEEHSVTSYAGYPLLFGGRLEGVIGLFRRRPFTDEEFRVLRVFAAQAAIAIKTTAVLESAETRSERLSLENAYLQDELRTGHGSGSILGRSPALLELMGKLGRVAPTDTTVLLLGETGTGKELLARELHAASPRRERALIKVNCGAISPGLVESELFGHEKGAFTGALQRRAGRFELADGGTLFLDEVGELPLDVQVKLLRVLQEGEFERVGGGDPIRSDARIVAATHRDLQADVATGRFRADLYYRLSVFPIQVPALRERAEDVPLLAQQFLEEFRRKLAKPLRAIAPASLERLVRYPWPGNVRELRNVIERACVLAQGEIVDVVDALGPPAGPAPARVGPAQTLEEVERDHILRVLEQTGGTIQGEDGAARILGLHPNTLRSRMERLGIARGRRTRR